jgi:DNA-binding MarR family transcriptional regulator
MPSRLATAIKQTKPFVSTEEEAFLAVQRTASELNQGVAELLKPQGLTSPQYNVLRILRGAGDAGLACREIADRLVARDPDVTRLLDRMENQGLIVRARVRADRRVVTTRITAKGRELVTKLDKPVADLHLRQLGHLGQAKLQTLLALLDEARTPGD